MLCVSFFKNNSKPTKNRVLTSVLLTVDKVALCVFGLLLLSLFQTRRQLDGECKTVHVPASWTLTHVISLRQKKKGQKFAYPPWASTFDTVGKRAARYGQRVIFNCHWKACKIIKMWCFSWSLPNKHVLLRRTRVAGQSISAALQQTLFCDTFYYYELIAVLAILMCKPSR